MEIEHREIYGAILLDKPEVQPLILKENAKRLLGRRSVLDNESRRPFKRQFERWNAVLGVVDQQHDASCLFHGSPRE